MKNFNLSFDNNDQFAVILDDNNRFTICLKNEGDYSHSIFLSGLVDSVLLSAQQLQLIMSFDNPELLISSLLHSVDSVYHLSMSQSAMQELMKLHPGQSSMIEMFSNAYVNVEIHCSSEESIATMATNQSLMFVVRPCVVSDWSGYYMNDLVGKTMQEMMYVEVT